MSTREQATIRSATYGTDPDHDVLVLTIECRMGGGGAQSFQACVDPKLGAAMVREICALFRVDEVAALAGQMCFVLRNWPSLSEPIEGFEIAGGRRWTKYDCVRRHDPSRALHPLSARALEREETVASLTQRIAMIRAEARQDLDTFVDWSAAGGATP